VRVLIADPIAQDGVDFLRSKVEVEVRTGLSPHELLAIIAEYDGLVVRSETRVTREVIERAQRLQVVARAGAGVDNIDVDAATRKGIVVVNAPAGNTIAAAEHTIALLLAVARHIPQADAALRRGEWDRGRFLGVEIRNKVLGIVGLGKIGCEVARRAQGLEMRVLAYDPYVSTDHAKRLGVELVTLDRLLASADFVTLHTPSTPQTRGMIGRRELARMKPTAYLINCARGSLVDEAALVEALEREQIAGAALDVFSSEPPPPDHPLLRHPRVVVTPHLGASTREAQVNVALQVAEQVLAVLEGRPALYAVNAPAVPPEAEAVLSPYLRLAQVLGNLCTQLAEGQFRMAEVTFSGEVAEHDTAAVKAALIKGLLSPISDEPVNLVNATVVAKARGLNVVERKSAAQEHFTSLVTLTLTTDRGQWTVAGTAMNGDVHIVRIDGYWVDIVPTGGYMLISRHQDRPGIIGRVGTILGENDINISAMQVGRERPRGEALMALAVDEYIPPEVLARIAAVPNIGEVKVVKL